MFERKNAEMLLVNEKIVQKNYYIQLPNRSLNCCSCFCAQLSAIQNWFEFQSEQIVLGLSSHTSARVQAFVVTEVYHTIFYVHDRKIEKYEKKPTKSKKSEKKNETKWSAMTTDAMRTPTTTTKNNVQWRRRRQQRRWRRRRWTNF